MQKKVVKKVQDTVKKVVSHVKKPIPVANSALELYAVRVRDKNEWFAGFRGIFSNVAVTGNINNALRGDRLEGFRELKKSLAEKTGKAWVIVKFKSTAEFIGFEK